MTLRNLEVFLAVVKAGSMHGAAEALFISQPSVSGVVAELEKEYDVRLFERFGRRLYITPEGQRLAECARRMCNLGEETRRVMGSAKSETPLRIGATVTVGTCVLCPIIERMQGAPPVVMIHNTRRIEQLLLANRLDAALVEGDVQSPDLRTQPIMEDDLQLVCRAQDALAQRGSLSLQALRDVPLLLREEGSGTRCIVDEAFAARGLAPRIRWECSNTQAILNAVRAGLGVSLLSPLLLQGQSGLASVPVTGRPLRRRFLLVVHKDKFITDRLHDFEQLCRDFLGAGQKP